MKNIFPVVAVAGAMLAAVFSCSDDTARIKGQSVGLDSRKVRLEEALPYGYNVVDSTVTDSKGNYRFRVTLPDGEPTLYNLRIDDEVVPLFISAGERVEVFSLLGNTRGYQVEGSKESSLIKEVNDILQNGAAKLDSLADARSLREEGDREERREAMMEYAREYHRIKREHIAFIVRNSGSLAAIYALERRLPGDPTLFNAGNDFIYYQMVADSVSKTHPGSRYLLALQNTIGAARASEAFLEQFRESMEAPVPFPEIEMPDIYGTLHSLSDNRGSVVLLDFWSAAEEMAAVVNAEYREIYEEFADRGLVIFQVNMDTSKPAWVNAVLDQKLPWISVSDLQGPASPAAGNYNITKVPSNYLIDTEGDIVARDIFGDELRREIEKLIDN